MKKTNSEFGKGFVYNLVLFAKHWERLSNEVKRNEKMRMNHPDLFSEEDAVSMWFNGAADHFFEFEVPDAWKKTTIGRLARRLQNKALRWRYQDLGKFDEAKKFMVDLEKLCRMIDKKIDVNVVEADWN